MQEEGQFWKPLLLSISKKTCLPFLGNDSHSCIEYSNEEERSCHCINLGEISKKLLDGYDYPLEETSLTKVAQFLAIQNQGNNLIPKIYFSEILSKIKPPDFSLEKYDNTPYSVLSNLPLPIYITTNYDHFMEAALISRGRQPISDFCRWTDDLLREEVYADLSKDFSKDIFYFNGIKLSSVVEQGNEYRPTVERPLVYHLYGSIAAPDSMVLTEKDYFDFVINLHSRRDVTTVPSHILTSLARSSLMFIGYDLEEISFRVIFQGFISMQKTNLRPTSIAVHVPKDLQKKKAMLIMQYLSLYTQNVYSVNIKWSNINEFVSSLRSQWANTKAVP